MLFRRLLLVLTATLAITSMAPSIVLAQTSATTPGTATRAPTDAQRQRARELYAEGQRHFQAERFTEALTAFEGAYAQVPNPVVLLGVASAQERLGRTEDAARTLRRYLRERADAPDRAEVEQRIAQYDPTGLTAERAVPAETEVPAAEGTIRIACTPEGAAIAIDGQDTGRTAPAELQVPPGTHEVTLTLPGFQPIQQSVTVGPGAVSDLTLTLAAADEAVGGDDVFGSSGGDDAAAATASAAAETPVVDPGPSAGVWVTTAVAGVSLVTGTVFGFLALSAQSDFDSNPTFETADRGNTFALVADLAFGVAIAAGVTAIVLYATERPSASAVATTEESVTTEEESVTTDEGATTDGAAEPAPTSQRSDGPRFTMAPWGAPTGGGAAMQVTF